MLIEAWDDLAWGHNRSRLQSMYTCTVIGVRVKMVSSNPETKQTLGSGMHLRGQIVICVSSIDQFFQLLVRHPRV